MVNIKLKKVWKFIVYPVVLAIINFLLVDFVIKHYLNVSDIDSVLSDDVLSFDTDIVSIFSSGSNIEDGDISKNDITFPKVNTEYGKVEIESVNMSSALIFGDADEVLKHGIGQYNGSYIPGYGGTILITGHNYMFPQVENVNIGDIIKITTSYGVYKYKVSDLKVLNEKQYNSLKIDDNKEQLIYYTCYPFSSFGNILTRYFVYADYISGPKIIK